ncbi:hypothetical protein QUW03_04565 [Faecalicoccus acidiformans]|uniref:hypothetical protein n=1 Tax=Faecalicoccus acidiformans TaxID=915173 RepID=UPI0025A3BC0C|nr:hypothetical protein [Faecalicoccus acidiformans]MDM8203641.1 hypothetical protein [Faecalicoccus acidiformans]
MKYYLENDSDLQKSKKIIDKYDYIGFDIFDTLLKRNTTSPHDIFEIVNYYFKKEYSRSIEEFPKKRISSETQIWEKSYGEELTLDFIYDSISNINERDKEILKEIEIQCEILYCQNNLRLFDLYNYCVKRHKSIVLISDMYLPKNVIKKMLSNSGITQYSDIFISGEEHKSKARGSLFDLVLSSKNINPKNMLFIGDSLKSDFLIPRFKKINTIKVPTNPSNCQYFKQGDFKNLNLNERVLLSCINNNAYKYKDYNRIGYEILGPLLIGFCYWLKLELKKYNLNNVYFLSRDGFIVKKAFDILYGQEFNTYYFCVSRKSLSVPLLCDVKKVDNLRELIKFRKNETLSGVLNRLGLEVNSLDISEITFKRERIFNDKNITKEIEKYLPEIRKNAKKQKSLFLKYANEHIKENRIGLVDIGWHGSMQDYLHDLLPGLSVEGFYFGLDRNVSNKKHAYLNNSENDLFDPQLISSFRGVIETFFSAYHGSTDSYSPNGAVFCKESVDFKTLEIIKNIHQGAIQLVQDVNRLLLDMPLSANFVYYPMNQLLTKPTISEIKLFRDISFSDVTNKKLLPSDLSFFKLLLHPYKTYKLFMDSDWRIGFLKQLFKLPLRYDSFMKFITKKFS